MIPVLNESSYGVRENIFLINDIDLIVPPSQISINQEDLLYQWKTLRTKASTKIPTGHGQTRVLVSLQFTNDMLLDFHRLILQLSHTPFCSIENDYLRQSLVPHWPLYQQMAFTLTSLNLVPVAGTSDCFNLELDLIWFNYFPYSKNFLYRLDWNTNWMESTDPMSDFGAVKLSIGWSLDPKTYNKVHRPSVVDEGSRELLTKTWDTLNQAYTSENKSIIDLERFHYGETFDLLPGPGNMEPASFVKDARQSRIYTRFYNYLQRDSFIKNFGLNIEETLGEDRNLFFATKRTVDGLSTYGLHSGPVPREIKASWISKMLSYNGNVTFYYNEYQEVKFPNTWTQLADKERMRAFKSIVDEVVPTKLQGTSTQYQPVDAFGKPKGPPIDVRNGWWSPTEKVMPFGSGPGAAAPASVSEVLSKISKGDTAGVSIRTAKKDNEDLYAGDSSRKKTNGSRLHKGTDFSTVEGTPVFAVEDATVVSATIGSSGSGLTWNWYNSESKERGVVDSTYGEEWKNTMVSSFGEQAISSKGKYSLKPSYQTIGTFVRSVKNKNIYFFSSYGDGGQAIYLKSPHGRAGYLHLSKIDVSVGDIVKAGQKIGETGRTSTFDNSFLAIAAQELVGTTDNVTEISYQANSNFNEYLGNTVGYNAAPTAKKQGNALVQYKTFSAAQEHQAEHGSYGKVFTLPKHLHFEYYEVGSIPSQTGEISSSNQEEILVDPVPSLQAASDKSKNYIPEFTFEAQVDVSAEENINDGLIQESEISSLRDAIIALNEAGWIYYDKNYEISNVWYKTHKIVVSNELTAGPEYTDSDIVFSNVSGGFRHIVANIPLLSHEYPTQQFLGSIEPAYTFDFAVKDSTTKMSGISFEALKLQKMRSSVQSNARSFRPVMDSWGIVTDSFITRLFGSYQEGDVFVRPYTEALYVGVSGIDKYALKKRTSIMSSSATTIPGSPGLSSISFQVQHTNPYEQEKLETKSIKFGENEEIRKSILQALYNYQEIGTRPTVNAIENTQSEPTSGNIFQQALQLNRDLNFDNIVNNYATPIAESYVRPVASTIENLDQPKFSTIAKSNKNIPHDFALLNPFYKVDPLVYGYSDTSVDYLSNPETLYTEITATSNAVEDELVNTEVGFQTIEPTDVYAGLTNEERENELKILAFRSTLLDVLYYAEKSLAEHEDLISNGTRYSPLQSNDIPSAIPKDEIQKELYDLPINPRMWKNWQYYVTGLVQVLKPQNTSVLSARSDWITWQDSADIGERSKKEISEYILTEGPNLLNKRFSIQSFLPSLETFALDRVQNEQLQILQTKNKEYTDKLNYSIPYVDAYISMFSIRDRIAILGDSYSYTNLFGGLFGLNNKTSERGFESFRLAFQENLSASKIFGEEFDTALSARRTIDFLASRDAPIDDLLTRIEEQKLLNAAYKDSVDAFVWPVSKDEEIAKVAYFKNLLIRISDDILQKPDLLKLLNLQFLEETLKKGSLKAGAAYPDIDLPTHPFFGDHLSVNPDFYMWNLYEDGEAFNESIQNEMFDNVYKVISNSYASMKKFENGIEINPNVTKNKNLVIDSSFDDTEELLVTVKFAAEGTDTGEFGPMDSPYYKRLSNIVNVDNFNSQIQTYAEDAQKAVNNKYAGNAQSNTKVSDGTPSALKALGEEGKVSVRLSNAEGYVHGNIGAGIHYPSSLQPAQYNMLVTEINQIEQMFGTSQGSAQQNILPDNTNVYERLNYPLLGRVDEFAHPFDVESLKKLALDSSKDILSQRITMKSAYPTFKLYFVEEDGSSNFSLSYDDFTSYNAVQSFTVESSRRSPADHAIITIQNVSGTLDGTKRGSVVDLDYFGANPGSPKEIKDATQFADEQIAGESSSDQPYNALVLRPGVNVQLRAGYANDPDHLQVLLNGRVVDIQWNKNGDLAEIMVQSFGTELVQALKGSDRSAGASVFATTHQLLGALMLEPELEHFGRWQMNKIFQYGESQDSRLDFYNYSKDSLSTGFLGQSALRVRNWRSNHPYLAARVDVNIITPFILLAGTGYDLAKITLNDFVNIKPLAESIFNPFTRQKVSLFLSPQDDNLYPPHPKDYITLDIPWYKKASSIVVNRVYNQAIGIFGEGYVTSGLDLINRWWNSNKLFMSKKVSPADAEYTLLSTNIWKVFHEMSLRHPGWIYATRPYGTDFRYTMFFGVPSQRYWSKGSTNEFVARTNDLREFIQNAPSQDTDELKHNYIKLYGSLFEGTALDDHEGNIYAAIRHQNQITLGTAYSQGDFELGQSVFRQSLVGPALKEYLRALNHRFIPFRRYHLLSSDRNLVWNGLISSENAVTNAVDVTYFNPTTEGLDDNAGAVGSMLFKAHSFIPESRLRIAPVRWPNCKGLAMASRYGMGELLHRMRSMYRGEIIIHGNPRVRPWDIGILVDTYNDMVGPIEVDSVIHTFSHETGFLTEIKPNAVVIGNEISSYPMLEAMQTFSMAVLDIEKNYRTLKADGKLPDENRPTAGASALIFAGIVGASNLFVGEEEMRYLRSTNPELFQPGATYENLVFNGVTPTTEYDLSINKLSQGYRDHLEFQGVDTASYHPLYLVDDKYKIVEFIDGVYQNSIPNVGFLLGGPILFLQCLRQDSIIVVPLLKNGNPITSGLTYNDPTMFWNRYRGDINQIIDDTLDGTKDLLYEYQKFGTYMWNNIEMENFYSANLTGE